MRRRIQWSLKTFLVFPAAVHHVIPIVRASRSMKKLVVVTVVSIMLMRAFAAEANANDIYSVDPVVDANTRVVDGTINRNGAIVDIPSSGGVSAQLVYDKNDGANLTFDIRAVGPTVIDRYMRNVGPYLFAVNPPWRPLYVLTINFGFSSSARYALGAEPLWVTFDTAPKLTLTIRNAKRGTLFFMDVFVQDNVHFMLSPTLKSTDSHLVFDFADLPLWYPQERDFRVPIAGATRLIVMGQ